MSNLVTLADVQTRLQSAAMAPSHTTAQHARDALETLGRLLGTDLKAIPADPQKVSELIASLGDWQACGFADQAAFEAWKTWALKASVQCPIASRSRHFGSIAGLSPAWKAIDEPIAAAVDRGHESRWALACVRHIFKFASRLEIPPENFDNAAFQALLRHHADTERPVTEKGERSKRRRVSHGVDAGRAWNRFAQSRGDKPWLESFPAALLFWQGQQAKRNIQISEMTPALQADIAVYVSWMKQDSRSSDDEYLDILNDSAPLPLQAEVDPRPFLPETLNQSLSAIRLSVTAAVEIGGQPLDSLVSLHQVAGVTALGRAIGLLEGRLLRDGRDPDTKTSIAMARRLIVLGKYLALPAETIQKMRAFMRTELKEDNKRRISVSRRRMLRQFDEPSKMEAWFAGPGKLFDSAEALRETGRITPSSISDVEIAAASKLIQCAGLTRDDLVSLRHQGAEPSFILEPHGNGTILVVALGSKIISVPLDTEAETIFGAYLAYYRPAWLGFNGANDCDFLFPGKTQDGSRYAAGFSTTFTDRWRELGLDVTPQVCRHLAAKNMMADGRNHASTVAAILGVSEDVIKRSFADANTDPAFRAYHSALLGTVPPKERDLLNELVMKYRRSAAGSDTAVDPSRGEQK